MAKRVKVETSIDKELYDKLNRLRRKFSMRSFLEHMIIAGVTRCKQVRGISSEAVEAWEASEFMRKRKDE